MNCVWSLKPRFGGAKLTAGVPDAELTLRVTVALWVRDAPDAVTVRGYVPGGVDEDVVIPSTPELPETRTAGVKMKVAPGGKFATFNEMFCGGPTSAVVEIPYATLLEANAD